MPPSAASARAIPAAPTRWPIIDFGELIGTRVGAALPKAALIARVSVTSLSGVDVPWATIQSISSGVTPALRRASPSPGSGRDRSARGR